MFHILVQSHPIVFELAASSHSVLRFFPSFHHSPWSGLFCFFFFVLFMHCPLNYGTAASRSTKKSTCTKPPNRRCPVVFWKWFFIIFLLVSMALITWLCSVRAANLENWEFNFFLLTFHSLNLSHCQLLAEYFQSKIVLFSFSHFYAMNILNWMNICLAIVYVCVLDRWEHETIWVFSMFTFLFKLLLSAPFFFFGLLHTHHFLFLHAFFHGFVVPCKT